MNSTLLHHHLTLRLVVALCIFFTSAKGQSDDIDYLRDIKPIFRAKCYSCHGALQQESNLRLDTVQLMRRGGEGGEDIVSNTPDGSELFRRITSTDDSSRMPPEGEPVSPEQIERIRIWLKSGADGPADEREQANPKTHWAFQPVTHPTPPASGHPIDAFIDQKLAAAGLKRAPAAKPLALVRRMFLDLHGLPPTPDDVAEWENKFSAGGPADIKTAHRALIDKLLASPRYGERWAQHWLDVVRYADTHGYEVNTPRPNAWPYRDYVIRAFNEDKPYDRFVLEQLAGDTVGEDAATGFMVAAAALLPGQIGADDESKRLARQDELDEIIVGTTATFLGLTVGCARCHDHKFDPIPQSDYYAMQAFFAGVNYGDREVKDDEYTRRAVEADALQPKIDDFRTQLSDFAPRAFTGQTIIIDDEDTDRVTLLQEKRGHGANPEGKERGYKNDQGDESRFGNLSRSRYTWFTNTPGEDVFTWNPEVKGQFRVWVSWGAHGSGVHTRDARYVLDADGDLKTRDDQQEIARADQYYFAGITTGESEKKPLWSGLKDAGIHQFSPASRLVLRCGETSTGITADVIVLQEAGAPGHKLPQLRGPVSPLKTIEHFEPVEARFVRFTSFATIDDNKHEPCIDELEVFTADKQPRNIALAKNGTVPTSSGNYSNTGKHQLKHVNDGKYGNSRSWISNQAGKGWVQLEFPQAETINRIEWARDREGKFKDRLPVDYSISVSMDGNHWTKVASSADRVPMGTPHDEVQSLLRNPSVTAGVNIAALAKELRQLEDKQSGLRKPQMVFAGKFKKPETTFVLQRGDPEQPTDEIRPHVLTSIGNVKLPKDTPDQQRRTALARWITSKENPLAARVIVNRVWQYHFGWGLVETPSDFGLNGASPSHPQLLDWLTTEFVNNGWSIMQLHRLIMTSETYCQSSRGSDLGSEIDSENRLLWRFPIRRIEAEAIRDCILHVSGKLNLKQGGPGFNFFKTRGGLSGFPPVEEFTDNEFRRMVYAHKIRMERVPVFGAFDCPDAGLPTPRRSQSTTAIQALNLFNSQFVIDQAHVFAKRVEADAGAELNAQIELAFQLALGRSPTETEFPPVLDFVQQEDLATLCRVLFNSSEFLFMP